MITKQMQRQIETRLADNDIRLTSGRRAVINGLSRADGPKSAADLEQALRGQVPLSSIYRSLAVLEDAGVISPHYSTKGVTRYELADWLAGHHHHLVCSACGVVEDIEIEPGLEDQLESIVDRIGDAVSFSPVDHALEIEGKCARCQ